MRSNLEFAGKVALVTGGNSGIGAATAKLLAELGAQVVITGRRSREGQLLINEIACKGGTAAFFRGDLSQSEQVRRIVPFTVQTFGRLDYAFNNAGIEGKFGVPLGEQAEAVFDEVIGINLKGAFLSLKLTALTDSRDARRMQLSFR